MKPVVMCSLILGLVLASCTAAPEGATLPPESTEALVLTVAPQPPTELPEPDRARLWISPSLPRSLLETASLITHVGDLEIEWVDDPDAAQVRLEPNPEQPLSRWVYAIVARFPTIEDEITLQELREIWRGSQSDRRVFVSAEIEAEMAPLLGLDGAANVVAADQLVGSTWSDPNSIGIVPFELLEPRLKVLRLNGASPLDSNFDSLSYSLAVSYGLSGDPAMVESVAARLEWPQSNRDPDKLTSVLMTGVSALVRATAWRMDLNGADYPGEQIAEAFRRADITHVSHESAFSEDCPPPDPVQTSLKFCSAPRHVSLFDTLGVDLIELTGNHLADWGTPALLYTLDLYDELGIKTFAGGRNLSEARQPELITHNGNWIAFFGCNAAGPAFSWAQEDRPGSLPCGEEGISDQVRQLHEDGYSVIFTFQWPESDSPRPLPGQIEAFRAIVDSGAVIVSGSQAHRPQAMEFHSDGFIHYGLGNLFFDQMHALQLRQEFLDRHMFYDGRHISTELITAMLEDYAQPRPTSAAERQSLLLEIFAASGW